MLGTLLDDLDQQCEEWQLRLRLRLGLGLGGRMHPRVVGDGSNTRPVRIQKRLPRLALLKLALALAQLEPATNVGAPFETALNAVSGGGHVGVRLVGLLAVDTAHLEFKRRNRLSERGLGGADGARHLGERVPLETQDQTLDLLA
eukprot:scaffold60393_cov28-Tisochrysis_lutea.AAC.3